MSSPEITAARAGLGQLAQFARGLQYAESIIAAVEDADRLVNEAEARLASVNAEIDKARREGNALARGAAKVIHDEMIQEAQAEATEIRKKANLDAQAIEKSIVERKTELAALESKLEATKKVIARHVEGLSALS
jgi:formate dehydrogenase assembly factor FdhD